MNRIRRKLYCLMSALMLTAYAGIPAYADDIDIYQTQNLGNASVRPNVLFILDTSGSMGGTIASPASYDPTVTYGTCFDTGSAYAVPTADFDNVECTNAYTGKNVYDASLVQCSSMILAMSTDETASGYFTDTYAQWDNHPQRQYWTDVSEDKAGYVIECHSDDGLHGDGGTALYINRAGATPFTSIQDSNNWNNLGQNVTLVGGNYMNFLLAKNNGTAGTGAETKIDIMRDVIKSLVFGVAGVNVGLMRFNASGSGGTVKHQVSDVLDTRNDMFATMKTWTANGVTPLSESLYEAYRYYKGQTELFGEVTEGDATITENGTKYYKSPVDLATSSCQRHYVILLSDGVPVGDNEADDEIEGLAGFNTSGCDGSGDGHCLEDLADYMYNTETSAYLGGGTSIDNLRVSTYTVAFDASIDLMRHAGNLGSGNPEDTQAGFGYFETYDATGLLQTLLSIIENIKAIHTTFSSPAVSVNAFNRTTHRDDLYYTLFRPSTEPQWIGNFKRYRLDFNDATGEPIVVDKNGVPAIDNISGFFAQDVTSYWTETADAPDGSDTGKGGAAGQLTNTRNVYTNITGTSNVSLTDPSNEVHEDNTALTKTMLGIGTATDAERIQLIQYMRGIDVLDEEDGDGDLTDARRMMGDPLHGQPALVQYGGPDSDPDITAFVVTNDGYLHAIDTRESYGTERFSFIPTDLLTNGKTMMQTASGDKLYGLDGTVVPWITDENEDGIVNGNDRVIIYFGMRRGGRNYYAMDVTDRANPRLLWRIEGGAGDFVELGQSWSKPTLRKVKLAGQDRQVMIFAAGYDPTQDTAPTRSFDTVGRGVFIVDALTGAKLWEANPTVTGFAEMNYSIPSDVAAVDPNGDGYTDIIYVGDMGGQVWRIDIDNRAGETEGTLANMVTGGRIAELSEDTAEGSRRFYYSPDVALMREVDGGPYLALVMVSGDRSNPMRKDVQDRVFMLRDRPINSAPQTYETTTENSTTHELLDTTDNLIGQGSEAERDAASQSLLNNNGWFIDLDMSRGEKGLAKPLIFGGEAYYTTYIPNDTTVISDACTPREGNGLLYHVNVANGTPVRNYDQIVSADDENLTREDRLVTELKKGGIPPDPKVIMPNADDAALCVGTECYRKNIEGAHETLYWYEE